MVSKIMYGLFSYALQPAKCTSASFMGAILKEYLVPSHLIMFNDVLTKSLKEKNQIELANYTIYKNMFILERNHVYLM